MSQITKAQSDARKSPAFSEEIEDSAIYFFGPKKTYHHENDDTNVNDTSQPFNAHVDSDIDNMPENENNITSDMDDKSVHDPHESDMDIENAEEEMGEGDDEGHMVQREDGREKLLELLELMSATSTLQTLPPLSPDSLEEQPEEMSITAATTKGTLLSTPTRTNSFNSNAPTGSQMVTRTNSFTTSTMMASKAPPRTNSFDHTTTNTTTNTTRTPSRTNSFTSQTPVKSQTVPRTNSFKGTQATPPPSSFEALFSSTQAQPEMHTPTPDASASSTQKPQYEPGSTPGYNSEEESHVDSMPAQSQGSQAVNKKVRRKRRKRKSKGIMTKSPNNINPTLNTNMTNNIPKNNANSDSTQHGNLNNNTNTTNKSNTQSSTHVLHNIFYQSQSDDDLAEAGGAHDETRENNPSSEDLGDLSSQETNSSFSTQFINKASKF